MSFLSVCSLFQNFIFHNPSYKFYLYIKITFTFLKANEEPPLPEIYSCQKCDFKHRSRADFQLHIKKHYNASCDGFQCTECGNSFVSLSALEKHLYMTHKVTNNYNNKLLHSV